jgi:hypothetical protein
MKESSISVTLLMMMILTTLIVTYAVTRNVGEKEGSD